MSLARTNSPLSKLIIRNIGDVGGPRSDHVDAELDNIVTWANQEAVRCMFTGAIKSIINTTNETTVFGTASAGSTLTIAANTARVGQIYRITVPLFVLTTGTPTGRLRIKLGSTLIADSTAIAFPTAALQSRGFIRCDLAVEAIGATGTARADPLELIYGDGTTVAAHNTLRQFTAGGSAVVDFTAAQAIDVTWQWGTASLSNDFHPTASSVLVLR